MECARTSTTVDERTRLLMTEQVFQPIPGPAAWRGADLPRSGEWIEVLSEAEITELREVVARLRRHGMPREELSRDDVQLKTLTPAVRRWRETLERGRGFVLVRGLPVDRMDQEEAALAYWVLGLHLGTPVPQNFLR